jgi:hypothetical protein
MSGIQVSITTVRNRAFRTRPDSAVRGSRFSTWGRLLWKSPVFFFLAFTPRYPWRPERIPPRFFHSFLEFLPLLSGNRAVPSIQRWAQREP